MQNAQHYDYVTELTREKKVNPATFDRIAQYYSEREICEIAWLVASEHLYNMTNIGLNIHSDMLCDITRKQLTKVTRLPEPVIELDR